MDFSHLTDSLADVLEGGLDAVTESVVGDLDDASDLINLESPDVTELLLHIAENQIELLDMVNDIRNYIFFSIVFTSVFIVYVIIWRSVRVFF